MKTFYKLLLVFSTIILIYSFLSSQILLTFICLLIGLYLYYFKYEEIFYKNLREEEENNEYS